MIANRPSVRSVAVLFYVFTIVLVCKMQSSNFFAALDDSGDEAPAKVTPSKKETKAKKEATPTTTGAKPVER